MSTTLPPAAPRRSPPTRHTVAPLLALLLLPLLAGCSGTRFGEALSRSFSTADPADSQATAPAAGATPAAGTPLAPSGATASPQSGAATRAAGTTAAASGTASAPAAGARSGKPDGSSSPAGPTVSRPAPGTVSGNPARPPATASAQPPRPAPYRVTILLPQADAAAPAEVVTQALRAAGVPFEVETIERLGRSSANASPQAPVSRPAPEPR